MLEWKRDRDGCKHNGEPCYEYRACGDDERQYHIVWADNAGFGYTAIDAAGNYMTKRWGIHWCGSLRACKRLCEEIEADHTEPHSKFCGKSPIADKIMRDV